MYNMTIGGEIRIGAQQIFTDIGSNLQIRIPISQACLIVLRRKLSLRESNLPKVRI